jgi:outer membrane protein
LPRAERALAGDLPATGQRRAGAPPVSWSAHVPALVLPRLTAIKQTPGTDGDTEQVFRSPTCGETTMLSRLLTVAVAAVVTAVPVATAAQSSPWLVRLRAAYLVPADKSSAIPALGLPEDAIDVSNKLIPELDISYFFAPNWAAELVLTYPQKHDVSVNGTDIGSFKHLPPTLLLQYHFTPEAAFSPYVGVGINYTRISSVELAVPGADLERSSWGPAFQLGGDIKLDRNWSVNVDVKWVQIRSDLLAAGTAIGEVKVDPWIYSIGIGYRF